MWTYLLYFNLLSIAMIDSIGCWKNTCQWPLRIIYSYSRDFAQYLPHSIWCIFIPVIILFWCLGHSLLSKFWKIASQTSIWDGMWKCLSPLNVINLFLSHEKNRIGFNVEKWIDIQWHLFPTWKHQHLQFEGLCSLWFKLNIFQKLWVNTCFFKILILHVINKSL